MCIEHKHIRKPTKDEYNVFLWLGIRVLRICNDCGEIMASYKFLMR